MSTDGEIIARHFGTRQRVRVCWAGGLVSKVEPIGAGADSEPWIMPGLFDVQVNGYGGIDFQQDHLSGEELLAAVRALRAAGCGRFLPRHLDAGNLRLG